MIIYIRLEERPVMKRFLCIALAALVCLSAALSAGCGGKAPDTGARKYENSIGYYYTPEDTSSHFFVNSDMLGDRLGGEVEAFLTCDGTIGITRVGTGLYRVDKDGVLMVHPAAVDRALLSIDGDLIVFTTATEVHTYRHSTEESASVKAENCASILSIVLSPDSQTVGYTVQGADGELRAYAWSGGESRKLGDDAYITGISDDAEFWYYLTSDADLYYAKEGGSRKKLGSECASVMEFNRDLTEVVFDMNSVTYFSKNGGSAKRIMQGASMLSTAGECFSTQGGDACTSYVKDCATLFDTVFYNYMQATGGETSRTVYDIWYVDAGGRATALARGAYQFSKAKGGDKVTCLIDSDLYVMDANDPGTAESIATNVYSYIAAPDLSVIYCVGYNLGLYRINDLGPAKLVLENAVYCLLTDGGDCLCIADFEETGTLCLVGPTGEPEKQAEKAYMAETRPGFCCYYSAPYEDSEGRTVYDLYVSPDGRAFELKLTGVKLASN